MGRRIGAYTPHDPDRKQVGHTLGPRTGLAILLEGRIVRRVLFLDFVVFFGFTLDECIPVFSIRFQ